MTTQDGGDPGIRERAASLCERARHLPVSERETFVRREAGHDRVLVAVSLSLLGMAEAAGDQVQSTATGALLEKLQTSPRLDPERYQLEGELGQGGMGAVIRIHDRILNRRVAMKVLLERAAPRDEEERQLSRQLLGRFLEEAQVTSQLDHPGVVPVHELGLDQLGKVWFTMRMVKGRTASEVFADCREGLGEWDLMRGLDVVLKVCDTMAYAHEKGVLHRDLKPQNVMVGRFGEVYVMDWGLAKVLGQADRHDVRIRRDPGTGATRIDSARSQDAAVDAGSSVVSMDGQQLGTPSYMSPEQARSEELDMRTDVYSLGAMLYELVTGRAPYTVPMVRQPAYRILNDVVDGPPKPIEAVRKGVPPELIAIVEKAMARNREQRYPAIAALSADLRAFVSHRAVGAYRTGALVEARLWIRRNRALATSLAAAGLLLLAGLVATSWLLRENVDLAATERAQREKAQSNAAEALAQQRLAERALADTEVQLERAELEEAGAWLERARSAAEGKDHLRAALLAGRAVGYVGHGRPASGESHWSSLPLLAGRSMEHFAEERSRLVAAAETLLGDHAPVLPLWSSPRYADGGSLLAYSHDGALLATAGSLRARGRWAEVWETRTGAFVGRAAAGGLINALAFSSDGAGLLLGTGTGAEIWEARTAKPLQRLPGRSVLGFDPSGTRALELKDGLLTIVDMESGAMVCELGTPSLDRTPAVAFSSDGRRVAVGISATAVSVHDVGSGVRLSSCAIGSTFLRSLAFHPDGASLAIGSGYTENRGAPTLQVFDVATGEVRKLLLRGGVCGGVAFTPDGSQMVAQYGHTMFQWDTTTWDRRVASSRPLASVRLVASPDGSRIASVNGEFGAVLVADARTVEAVPGSEGHLGRIHAIAISPDGTSLASASEDRSLRLWTTTERSPMGRCLGHEQEVSCVAFSPDGALVVSGSFDSTLRVWDPLDGRLIRSIETDNSVAAVSFHPDGTRLVSGGDENEVTIRDTARWEVLHTLRGHAAEVTAVTYSGDGTRILSGDRYGVVRVWNAESGQSLGTLNGHESDVCGVVSDGAGDLVTTADANGTIRIWDGRTFKELRTIRHGEGLLAVAMSRDGSHVASAGQDVTIRVWDASDGKLVHCLTGHSDWVSALAFSGDGLRLYSGSRDRTVRAWDMNTHGADVRLQGKMVSAAVIAPDGHRILGGDLAHQDCIHAWDATTGVLLQRLAIGSEWVRDMACNSSGSVLASGGGGGNPRLCTWDPTSGELLRAFPVADESVGDIAFGGDDRYLACVQGTSLLLWGASIDAPLLTLPAVGAGRTSFDRDAARLRRWSEDGVASVWNVESGELLAGFAAPSGSVPAAWHPDGTSLATYRGDAIRILGAATGRRIREVPVGAEPVRALGWSLDGRYLVTSVQAGEGWAVHVRDGAGGQLVSSVRVADPGWRSLDYQVGPDGGILVVSSNGVWTSNRATGVDLHLLATQSSLQLNGRDLEAVPGNLYGRTFPMLHLRDDLYRRLAEAGDDASRKAVLRMQLCARGGAWRAAILQWQAAEASLRPAADAELRRHYLTLLLASARDLLAQHRATEADVALLAASGALTESMCAHPVVATVLHDLAATILEPHLPRSDAAVSFCQQVRTWLPKSSLFERAVGAKPFTATLDYRQHLRAVFAARVPRSLMVERMPLEPPAMIASVAMALQASGYQTLAIDAYRRLLDSTADGGSDSPWAGSEAIEALDWPTDEEQLLDMVRGQAIGPR